MTQHTSGPWRACRGGDCPCRQVWSIPGDMPVFTARPDGSRIQIGLAHHDWGDGPDDIYGTIPEAETEANARLIAAAPNLLAACEGIIELLDSGQLVRNTTHDADPGWSMRALKVVAKLAAVTAAIEKATLPGKG